jgi:uncharacterized protein
MPPLSMPSFRRLLAAAALPALLLAACADHGLPTAPAPGVPAGPAMSAVAMVGSPSVVISQVYGGGGNSGAPYTHDYVELFNRGSTAVSLDGWSVQYASATGTGSFGQNAIAALSGTLEPGQYYLVRLAGGANGVALPQPDATGTVNMAAASGKVVLASTTAGIACNGGSTPCSAAHLALIVDLVGYGTANFYEGAAAAPALSNTTAGFRETGGCQDTDDNAADFSAGAPAPRNSASPPSPCPVFPIVVETAPAEGAASVPLDAQVAVGFDRPVTVSGEWVTVVCTTSGTHALTQTGGPSTYVLTPTATFASAESCTVTVVADGVVDAADPESGMEEDFSWSFTTVDTAVCELPFTATYTIQGSGSATPLAGQTVTTQGVVIGDFQGLAPALGGFYIQDPAGDGDAQTSDGLFVFNRGRENPRPAVGDLVRVTGRAREFQDQTQLDDVTAVVVCGGGYTVQHTDVHLPFPSDDYLERYEGMLVRLPQTLHVTEHFFLGRLGAVVLSSGGRLMQPTSIAAPGAPALAMQAANDRNRIIVDDDDNGQNPDPILFGRGGNPLTASNTLRGGDRAAGIVGVMTYTWAGAAASGNAFRVRPVNAMGGGVPAFVASNPRPAAPPPVGGTLKAAGFNLYNYFVSFSGCTGGVGGEPIGCRGANNATEFERQWRKTVAAIVAMDVDVLGVVEMENNGYGPQSAIADLVARLNAATGPGTYAFIDVDAGTGQLRAAGTDAVMNGIVYKPGRATPVGTTATLNGIGFEYAGNERPGNRPALAQAFQQANGARFVVSVNHLRSKGGSPCTVPDQDDGQGNCNVMRTNAATMLRDWLATDPTGSGVANVLIVGDLNAYAMEDPVRVLTEAGYTNLPLAYDGPSTYSYVFDGQWGYLDHALASPTLRAQVTGTAKWHINADEPVVLDYSMSFKSPAQLDYLYAPDPFRTSDHDPVIVGLDLRTPFAFSGFLRPVEALPALNVVRAGSAVPVEFRLGGDHGLAVIAAGFPRSAPVACNGTPATGIEEAGVTAGQSALSYDAATDTYTYVWHTSGAWSGTCRQFVLRLVDGFEYRANFQFR